MMMAAPTSIAMSGTSPNTTIAEHHRPDDHRVLIRHHRAAGASLSERLTQTCATIATTPSSASSTRSRGDGVTQANGASTAPNTSAATVWS